MLFLAHDRTGRGRKLYKYALTIVDIASRFQEAEPLATKEAKEVADALERIYSRSPLTWPKLLQVDPGRQFLGKVNTHLAKHNTKIRRGRVNVHRDQEIVERWNRTLAERLFGHQYAQEMLLPEGKRSTEWVKRLPSVVKALNGEVTRLTGLRQKMQLQLKRLYKSLLQLFLEDQLVSKSERYRLELMFDIYTNQVNLKVECEEQLIQFGQ